MMVEYRFRKKCVLLDRLWKQGDTIMLPEDFFKVKSWKVPPHMELASEPDVVSPNPKDKSAWQGKRDHSGESPEERAVRETDEAKAAAVPDTGPPGDEAEDDDGLGL